MSWVLNLTFLCRKCENVSFIWVNTYWSLATISMPGWLLSGCWNINKSTFFHNSKISLTNKSSLWSPNKLLLFHHRRPLYHGDDAGLNRIRRLVANTIKLNMKMTPRIFSFFDFFRHASLVGFMPSRFVMNWHSISSGGYGSTSNRSKWRGRKFT